MASQCVENSRPANGRTVMEKIVIPPKSSSITSPVKLSPWAAVVEGARTVIATIGLGTVTGALTGGVVAMMTAIGMMIAGRTGEMMTGAVVVNGVVAMTVVVMIAGALIGAVTATMIVAVRVVTATTETVAGLAARRWRMKFLSDTSHFKDRK